MSPTRPQPLRTLAIALACALSLLAAAPVHAMATDDLSNSGVPASSVDVIGDLFVAASERMAKIVLRPPGGTDAAQAFAQGRAATQLRQVQQILASLKRGSATWTGSALTAAVTSGVALADRQAADAGVRPARSPLAGSFHAVDRGTVQTFARDIFADLSKAADSMATRATTVLRQTRQLKLSESTIDRVLAGGVIDGQPRQAIRELRQELQAVHGGTVRIVGRSGKPIEFDVRTYAELVARTKTRQATVVARHERLESTGLDLVAIVGRVSNNFCSGYLGKVFSISGRDSRYPALSSLPGGGPPFHPNCTKSTRPFLADLASAAQLKAADGVPDADQLLNVDSTVAQRRYKDLQVRTQVEHKYVASTKGSR